MKIHLLSDLHHEVFRMQKTRKSPTWDMTIPETECDVIALAGDIDIGTRGVEWAIEQSEKLNKPIVYVLGNHEYYKGNIDSVNRKTKAIAEDTNVHVLQNDTIDINGYRFIGATLWTNQNILGDRQAAAVTLRNKMNDYQRIRVLDKGYYKRLHPDNTLAMHQESIAYIENQLEQSKLPTVVLTHHAPSIKSIAEAHHSRPEVPAYASDLEGLIREFEPIAWLHGHARESLEYRIGNTIVASNQHGYVGMEDSDNFNSGYVLEV